MLRAILIVGLLFSVAVVRDLAKLFEAESDNEKKGTLACGVFCCLILCGILLYHLLTV